VTLSPDSAVERRILNKPSEPEPYDQRGFVNRCWNAASVVLI